MNDNMMYLFLYFKYLTSYIEQCCFYLCYLIPQSKTFFIKNEKCMCLFKDFNNINIIQDEYYSIIYNMTTKSTQELAEMLELQKNEKN